MATKINPISGFPEFLPQEQILFNNVMNIIKEEYERAGAVPIETAAVERVDTLLAKGANDKEIYGLRRIKAEGDNDAKDIALRFDLTVPLARYTIQNKNDLAFPFKRYQCSPVFRGERSQDGRYRQFYQCDIDVIGNGKLSLYNDAEMPVIIYNIFKKLNIGEFTIRINNRKVLTGFLNSINIEESKVLDVLNIMDAYEKVGSIVINDQLQELELDDDTISKIMELFSIKGSNEETIKYLESINGNEEFTQGLDELKTVTQAISDLGVPTEYYNIDLSIIRGLDYYTGTIYETTLKANPSLGSICSGGRYDNLTKNFTKEEFPGVGISIGLTRLIPQLIKTGVLKVPSQTVAPVLITTIQKDKMSEYLKLAQKVRESGIKCDIYLEDRKFPTQLKYANKKGFRYVVIIGEDEFENQTCIVRDMVSGEQSTLRIEGLVEFLEERL
jgi:histidyl-tRNA synthetase